jgi:carbonic anhydrase
MPLDPATFLPTDRRSFRYEGSLTTPPCSEGVRWTVMAQPVAVAADRLEALAAVLRGNSRPLQPRHDRALSLGGGD